MNKGIVISLFDYTGNWSRPWAEAGHDVVLVDIKHGMNVYDFDWASYAKSVYCVLAAPDCTDFSGSGARWWKEKDADGRTEKSINLIKHTCHIISELEPEVWALENPVGRLSKMLGKPDLIFNPCDYAGYSPTPEKDAYTKKTCLWGHFNKPEKKFIEPIMYTSKDGKKKGSWMWANLGGKSERTKELRSATPLGFSYAFWEANKQ